MLYILYTIQPFHHLNLIDLEVQLDELIELVDTIDPGDEVVGST